MDWSNVTAEDLIEALREVDWSSPPRPLSEFFSRFTVPRSYSKWNSRLKCNLYYYRMNYFIMIVFIIGLGFLRRPFAIVAAALTALSIAFLNDSTVFLMLVAWLLLAPVEEACRPSHLNKWQAMKHGYFENGWVHGYV